MKRKSKYKIKLIFPEIHSRIFLNGRIWEIYIKRVDATKCTIHSPYRIRNIVKKCFFFPLRIFTQNNLEKYLMMKFLKFDLIQSCENFKHFSKFWK